ncbi:MAG TPA: ABC transporter permease [Thermodesulfobacteriota bacterium]|nr:ABC transporter permease [Thermodesulfobacteriota bacterium]
MSPIVFIALKLLTERKRQALVSTLGVAIGVAAFISMSAVMNGFQLYFIRQAIDINAHITLRVQEEDDEGRILRAAYGDGVVADVLGSRPKELKDKIIGYNNFLKQYSADPRIVGIAPHLTGEGIINYGTKDKGVSMIGVDPELERSASVVDDYLQHKNLDKLVTDRNSVILGSELARDLGVKEIGKKVTIVSPAGGLYTLKVADFFDSGITSIDKTRVYFNMRTLQAILDKPNQVNELIVKLKDVDDAESIAREMSSDTGYYAESWQRAFRNFLQIFKMQNMITYMIVFAILIVSAFGIFNIMMMTVLEKKKDIAILKAIGYEDREITKIFVIQGILVGFIGALLGCLLGYLIQEWLASLRFDIVGIIRTKGFVLDRRPAFFVYGFIFAMLFSFLASFYPSWRASKLFPVDIFRSSV